MISEVLTVIREQKEHLIYDADITIVCVCEGVYIMWSEIFGECMYVVYRESNMAGSGFKLVKMREESNCIATAPRMDDGIELTEKAMAVIARFEKITNGSCQ